MNNDTRTFKEHRRDIYAFINEKIGKIEPNIQRYLSQLLKDISIAVDLENQLKIIEREKAIINFQEKLSVLDKKSKYNRSGSVAVRNDFKKILDLKEERIKEIKKREAKEELASRSFLPD